VLQAARRQVLPLRDHDRRELALQEHARDSGLAERRGQRKPDRPASDDDDRRLDPARLGHD